MRPRLTLTGLFLGLMLLRGTGARAQAVVAPPPQFDMLGFLQEATLDTKNQLCTPTSPALAGGTMTLNGIQMIVPCNTILQLPATSLTWAELFDPTLSAPVSPISAPLPRAPGQTGLALADLPAPVPSFEVHVQGNVLTDPVTGQQRYVIGLIAPISQQAVNVGMGTITYLDYTFGTLRVGGLRNDPACVTGAVGGGPSCSGALVQINDPVGRYGKPHSPDPRFTADTNNPTISATTGIPVCVPRVAPPVSDPLCPQGNRPLNGDPRFPKDRFLPLGAFLTRFDMPAPASGKFPDARQQVPLEEGDWVTFSGTLFKINPLGPSTRANTYLSVHTLSANLGIFTAPGVPPAYLTVKSVLIGSGGVPSLGLSVVTTTRLTVVGFTTDPTRFVEIDAVDVNPCTGEETLRLLATPDPATQPLRGRFVERVLGGFFMPPTREYLVISETGTMANVANGLVAGQYRLPNFNFVFPENLLTGAPVVSDNFDDLPFLAEGSGPLGNGGPVVGQLSPWPGSLAPSQVVCGPGGALPLVSAGASLTVASNDPVSLGGILTLDPNSVGGVISWIQTAGPPVVLTNANTLAPSFTAPTVAPSTSTLLTFQLQVTDQFGTGTSSVNVTVIPPANVVTFLTATWKAVASGTRVGKLTVSAISANPKAVTLTLSDVPVVGTPLSLGTLSAVGSPPAIYRFAGSSIAQPFQLILNSSAGGSAAVTCGDPSVTGVVTCQ